MPMQNVLQTVLNDNHRTACFLLNFVNQFNCLFPGSWIQICKGFIKEQNIYLTDHHTGKADTLFLSPGDLMRRMVKNALNVHKFRGFLHDLMHFIPCYTVVFKGESNIFRHGEPDKLAVRVLQNSPYRFGKSK